MADDRLSLWWLFLGAQSLDVLWALFILLGIEKLQIDAGLPSSKYVLFYMPYTHGLDTALLWSGGACHGGSSVLSLAPRSHRPPPRPAASGRRVQGRIGPLQSSLPGFILESLLLVGGTWLYLRATTAQTRVGRYGPAVFVALLLLINVFTYWGPAPPSPQAAAIFNEAREGCLVRTCSPPSLCLRTPLQRCWRT